MANYPIGGDTASLTIGGHTSKRRVPAGAGAVHFDVHLDRGKTTMAATFSTRAGQSRGAYFAYVQIMEPS